MPGYLVAKTTYLAIIFLSFTVISYLSPTDCISVTTEFSKILPPFFTIQSANP